MNKSRIFDVVKSAAVILIIAFALIACERKNETETDANNIVTIPEKTTTVTTTETTSVNSLRETGSNRPQYYIRSSLPEDTDNNMLMEQLKLSANPYTAIEAVGWSKNGLFAYRSKYLHDGGDWYGWTYSFVVINTVDDKVMEADYISMEPDVLESKRGELSVEYKTKWNAILEKHAITGSVADPLAEIKNDLLAFPVTNYNCWLDFSINRKTNFDEDYGMELTRDIINWKLIVGNDAVQKKVTEQADEKNDGWFSNISGRKILGYYKSPHENRIAIVLTHYDYISFSGGYYTVTLDLFGCNMNVGF